VHGIRVRLCGSLVLAGALALAACSQDPPAPEPEATEVPEELQGNRPAIDAAGSAQIGTPMEDRVATIGLLNKRNNLTQDFEMKPGQSRRVGNVVIRLQACERTAPWEMPQEVGAFVQVLVQDRGESDFKRIFSGWMFKNSPSLNVVEHPIYDVWVKDCAMSFPGEGAPAPRATSTPAPAPAATPAPVPSPSATAEPTTAE